MIGLTFVGIASQTKDTAENQSSTEMTGIVLVLIGMVGSACHFITEEKLIAGTDVDPLLVVGIEGLWGVIFNLVLLPIFQAIPCSN